MMVKKRKVQRLGTAMFGCRRGPFFVYQEIVSACVVRIDNCKYIYD